MWSMFFDLFFIPAIRPTENDASKAPSLSNSGSRLSKILSIRQNQIAFFLILRSTNVISQSSDDEKASKEPPPKPATKALMAPTKSVTQPASTKVSAQHGCKLSLISYWAWRIRHVWRVNSRPHPTNRPLRQAKQCFGRSLPPPPKWSRYTVDYQFWSTTDILQVQAPTAPGTTRQAPGECATENIILILFRERRMYSSLLMMLMSSHWNLGETQPFRNMQFLPCTYLNAKMFLHYPFFNLL